MLGKLIPFGRPRRDRLANRQTPRGVSAPLIFGCVAVFSLTVVIGLATPPILAQIDPPTVRTWPAPPGRPVPGSVEPPRPGSPPEVRADAESAGEGRPDGLSPATPLPRTAAGGTARVVRVIDGDTLVISGGEQVRILNIDTAEKPPRAKCAEEARFAQAAKVRLSTLVAVGEVVLVADGRDRDQYGRLLRRIMVDGEDVGERLIAEGLAHPWVGHKLPWCR